MGSEDRSSASEAVTVHVSEAKKQLDAGSFYLDVRTVEDFKAGHVAAEKIFNVPCMLATPEGRVKNPEFVNQVSSVCDKNEHLLIGCRSGIRSLDATSELLASGFEKVSDVGGGYLASVESGFPVKLEEQTHRD